MDEHIIGRLCDGLTGAAAASGLAAIVVWSLRGALLCAGVVVIAQLLRSSGDS